MVEGGDDRKPQEFFCLFVFVLIYSSLPPTPKYIRLSKEYAWQIQGIVTGNIKVCDIAFVVLKCELFFTRIIWRKISFYLFIFLSVYFGVYLTNIYYVLCTVWSTGDQRKCKAEVGLQLLYVEEKWSSRLKNCIIPVIKEKIVLKSSDV